MTLDQALREWQSKKRTMGCQSATTWLCSRVPSFHPVRYSLYNQAGDYTEHVVASNGRVEIDLAPYARVWED